MRSRTHYFTRAILALALFGIVGMAVAQTSVTTILDLWNVRNNLSGSYTQTADINLSVTNPANLTDWAASTQYGVGDIRKRPSDGYAYYCTIAHTSGNDFAATHWTKMWEAVKGWKPIGSGVEPNSFRGVYDGNGKIIYNLYINRGASPVADNIYPTDGEDNIGLFGYVENNTSAHTVIKNLTLMSPNVSGRRATGALVGKILLPITKPAKQYTVYIENCSAKGTGAIVKGFGATGGLVGANNSNEKQRVPIIRFCHTNVTVSATHPNNYTVNPGDTSGTPYNIKYGGVVGCNENGVTQDSFARGNVAGGDRVGGLAGCTIGGSIFRSYSTGTVARGITPGLWTGGIGGLVGVTSGKLPPGLGGTNATGSCENCFWDTETSGISTSPGGTGKTTTQMKTQSTFTNWDFVNVWGIASGTNDGYPYHISSPSTSHYYRTKATGNWNAIATWEYSSDESTWIDAVVSPDASNSISIKILNTHVVSLAVDVHIDATTIEAGGKILVPSGKTLYVDNGIGTDLQVNGILEVTGAYVAGINSETKFGTGSELIYNGTTAQETGEYFFSTVDASSTPTVYTTELYNLTLNNAAGLTFSKPVIISNVFKVQSGSYIQPTGTTINTDGVYSPDVMFFEFPATEFNIESYSASMSQLGLYPDFVNRQWSIDGIINNATEANRTKTITFYWTAADDNNFDWTGLAPAVFAGTTKLTTISSVVNQSPRSISASYPFPQIAGARTFKIGRDDAQTLPVELSSFTVSQYQGSSSMLQWRTQSETNVLGFSIYRGLEDDLATALRLDILIPATNTSQPKTYLYHDRDVQIPNHYYYWLESSDFDGNSTVYGPVNVHLISGEPGSPDVIPVPGFRDIYPNPFNPTATIRYGVDKAGSVEIKIYNHRGQLLRNLVNSEKSQGWHQVIWDGKNEQGHNVASGIYFARMNMNGKSYLHKMVMMK